MQVKWKLLQWELIAKFKKTLLGWVTKNPVILDTKDPETDNMARNRNKYRCCMSLNIGNGEWGMHWKYGNKYWKEKKVNNNSIRFSDSNPNLIIYCSYLTAIIEDSSYEKQGSGGDSL